tara:strand:+ start:506 stop:706 length:201 start_codon:yes stop_codon:yes gene_type:complete
MKLSKQAMGALMMALQKSLMEQSDITESLQKMDFTPGAETEGSEPELYVKNPPLVKFGNEDLEEEV